MFVLAVYHLWKNRTDKFKLCSVVELLIKSESLWSRINHIVIKIYYIKQLNYNTDITHKGWHLYLYIFNTFYTENELLAASMQCWRMVRALRSHSRCCLVVSSDEMSPYTSRSRTSSVTDRRTSVDHWLVNHAVWPERSLHLLSSSTSVELLATKQAGPLKRPSPSTITSLHDITDSFTSCYKSHRLQTRLRLLQNVVLSSLQYVI